MEFLIDNNFSEDEIYFLDENIPILLKEELVKQKRLVNANIRYLVDSGIKQYKEIFIKFYEIFLLDNSEFRDIFDKYEKEDLQRFLDKDINIIEYL